MMLNSKNLVTLLNLYWLGLILENSNLYVGFGFGPFSLPGFLPPRAYCRVRVSVAVFLSTGTSLWLILLGF